MKNVSLSLMIFAYLLIFLSCSAKYFVEIKPFNQKNFVLSIGNEKRFILSAVCEAVICRFSVFDMLGSPIISREFSNQTFKNNKFLPPNSNFDSLFLRIIRAEDLQGKKIRIHHQDFLIKEM